MKKLFFSKNFCLFILPILFFVSCSSIQENKSNPPHENLYLNEPVLNEKKAIHDQKDTSANEDDKRENSNSKSKINQQVNSKNGNSNNQKLKIKNNSELISDSQIEDELESNEDLQPKDKELSHSETSFSMDENPLIGEDFSLLCSDGLYYSAWKEQFNEEWLKNNKKLKLKKSKLKETMDRARNEEFIRIVYPSIEKTGYDFPFEMNISVLSWINYFTGAGRGNFVVWLRKSADFIPRMAPILEQSGLPQDLVYLSMIESGFNTKILSYAGAVGVWQFMPYTAKIYGLIINDWIDERRDPMKSTYAAARYLTDSYAQFGSWHLAAASYNCGTGCIQKSLRHYGENSSYFQLTSMGVVNKQTANYVPKIIAAMVISKNPEKFGFETPPGNYQTQTTILPLTRSILLNDLALAMNIDSSVLEKLNPELRLGLTPPPQYTKNGFYNLYIPTSQLDNALSALDAVPTASNLYLLKTKVRRAESLKNFSTRYRVTLTNMQKYNKDLKINSNVKKGQTITVPIQLGTGQYDKITTVKYKFSKKRNRSKKTPIRKKRIKKQKASNNRVLKKLKYRN